MNFSMVAIDPSSPGFFGLIVFPILLYAVVAVASEVRWNGRGLLYSWLIATPIVPTFAFASMLVASRSSEESPSSISHGLIGVTMLALFSVTFGAIAVTTRATGANSKRPRSTWVRVVLTIVAGAVTCTVSLIAGTVALALS